MPNLGFVDLDAYALSVVRPAAATRAALGDGRTIIPLFSNYGFLPFLRFNHLHPPFDDPTKRRALLPAIVQSDFMQAIVGEDRSLWQDGVGFFPPGTAMASDLGLEALTGPRSQ